MEIVVEEVNFERPLVCIEYPGLVENAEKAIQTLGGIRNISHAHCTNGKLQCKFRPENYFCSPAYGKKSQACGLVVKIRRRKSDDQYFVSILGHVVDSYKFNLPIDYQYLTLAPDESDPKKLKDVYLNIFPDFVPTWSWLEKGTNDPLILPPPIFSRIETNSLIFKKNEIAESARKGHIRAILRNRKQRPGHTTYMSFDKPDTPMQPHQEAVELLEKKLLSGELYETLKKTFEERPIWSKSALLTSSTLNDFQLRYLLPATAYYFTNGPWRTMWVRFGYDPRKHPESRIYQTLDFRVRVPTGLKSAIKTKRGMRISRMQRSGERRTKAAESFLVKFWDEKKIASVPGSRSSNHILGPGQVPPSKQVLYQYCDIHLPQIQQMIQRLPQPGPASACSWCNGWLPAGFSGQCREIIMKSVLKVILQLKRDEDAAAAAASCRPGTSQEMMEEEEEDEDDEDYGYEEEDWELKDGDDEEYWKAKDGYEEEENEENEDYEGQANAVSTSDADSDA